MNIAVLSKKRTIYSTKRIVEELKKRGATPLIINPMKCEIFVSGDKQALYYNKRPMKDVKCVIPRIGSVGSRYGLAVLSQLTHMNIPSTASARGIAIAMNKFRSLQELSIHGIDVPKSVLIRDPNNLENAIKRVGGVPVIAKLTRGTQGRGVILIESKQAAASTLDAVWSMGKHILIQQYIMESNGTDIRVITVNGEAVAGYKRIAKTGEFRSNYHKGALGLAIELSDEQKQVAVKSAEAFGLGFAGVDMVESVDGLKVLEVNASPGFQGIESVTDINVAGKLADYVLQLAEK